MNYVSMEGEEKNPKNIFIEKVKNQIIKFETKKNYLIIYYQIKYNYFYLNYFHLNI